MSSKGCCRMHASYTRDIISFYHGKRQESQVVIPRVYCESCGTTHALIPVHLIPYGSYSIRFILAVIYVYSKKKYSVEKLCEHYSISISTLYTWLKLFHEHFNSWFSIMEQTISVSSCAILKIYSLENFPSRFFKRFNFSFLQLRKTSLANLSPPDWFFILPIHTIAKCTHHLSWSMLKVWTKGGLAMSKKKISPAEMAHFRFALIAPVIFHTLPRMAKPEGLI